MIRARRGRAVLALAGVLALAACQQPPQQGTYFDASALPPPGNLTQSAGAVAPPAGAVPPGFDGAYRGSMYRTSDPGGMDCAPEVPIYGFSVSANRVQFGQFRGNSINPDGTVQLQEGQLWLDGRFDGRQFVGDLRPWGMACTYRMVLNRT